MSAQNTERPDQARSEEDNERRPHVTLRRRPVYVSSFPVTALFLLASGYTLYIARDIFVPIVVAFVLYLVLSPIHRALARLRLPSELGAAVIVLALIGAMTAGFYWLSGPVAQWMEQMPRIVAEVQDRFEDFRRPVEEVRRASEEVEKMADVGGDELRTEVTLRTPGLLERVVINVTLIGVQFFLILVLLYFLLATGEVFRENLVRVMPTFSDKRKAVAITRDIQREVSRYLLTITLINIGLGVAIGAGMFFVGMPSPFLWGVMATVLNFVPYFGALIGAGVVGMVALISFDALSHVLLAPAVYLLMTSLEGQIVTPSILGRRLTLNPLVIFVAVVLGGWLWGVAGALVAVPMLVTLKVVCDNVDWLAPVGEFIGGRKA